MSIPRKLIRQLCASGDTYLSGMRLFEEGQVKPGPETREDAIYHSDFLVDAPQGEMVVHLDLDNDNEMILSYNCCCEEFLTGNHACRHIAAALLFCENNFFNKGSGIYSEKYTEASQRSRQTDALAKNMLSGLGTKIAARAAASLEQELVTLRACLEILPGGEAFCSFQIGRRGQKAYVIRNLEKFLSDMAGGETVTYGKAFSFVHDEAALSPFSQRVYQFIRMYARFSPMATLSQKKSIVLTRQAKEAFFTLFEGKQIDVLTGGESFSAQVANTPPPITLCLKLLSGGSGQLYLNRYDFTLMEGRSRLFMLLGGTVYAIGGSYVPVLSGLLFAFAQKKSPAYVAKEDMGQLCCCLTQCEDGFLTFAPEFDITPYAPLPFTAKAYLDMEKENTACCRLVFCYGDTEFNAYGEPEGELLRNTPREMQVLGLVKQYFPKFDEEKKQAYLEGERALYNLAQDGISRLNTQCQVFLAKNMESVKVKAPAAPTVGVRQSQELLNLTFETDLSEQEVRSILSGYTPKKKYHRLPGGAFVDLSAPPVAAFFNLMKNLDVSAKNLSENSISIPAYRAMYLQEELSLCPGLSQSVSQGVLALCDRVKNATVQNYEVPEQLRGILRNYQKEGFRWLKTLASCGLCGILADDMGLGKTLEVITFFLSVKQKEPDACFLVVCPASLVLNWENEIQKFAPSLTCRCVIGASGERREILADAADVYVTSYELLRRDIDLYQGRTFTVHVIDEAQYIKNHNTKNAASVKKIESRHRFALTGTPVENSLAELWSIFDFLMPGYLYSYHKFRRLFEEPIVKAEDQDALSSLNKMVRPFLLRRLKSAVLTELPQKTETDLYAPLEGAQKKLYAAHQKLARSEIASGGGVGKIEILAHLTKLRQLCCDPSLLYTDYSQNSAKLALCLDLVESCAASGHKVLLFSQFTQMLAIMKEKLAERGISHYLLQGDTKKDERMRLVNAFNNDSTPVFLISLKAGGTGLNLTGADVVIHYDPWWNVSAQNQATDRAHRIGQKKNVTVYKLILKNTIEEKIQKIQQTKSKIVDMVISDSAPQGLTREDILALLSE